MITLDAGFTVNTVAIIIKIMTEIILAEWPFIRLISWSTIRFSRDPYLIFDYLNHLLLLFFEDLVFTLIIKKSPYHNSE